MTKIYFNLLTRYYAWKFFDAFDKACTFSYKIFRFKGWRKIEIAIWHWVMGIIIRYIGGII